MAITITMDTPMPRVSTRFGVYSIIGGSLGNSSERIKLGSCTDVSRCLGIIALDGSYLEYILGIY